MRNVRLLNSALACTGSSNRRKQAFAADAARRADSADSDQRSTTFLDAARDGLHLRDPVTGPQAPHQRKIIAVAGADKDSDQNELTTRGSD